MLDQYIAVLCGAAMAMLISTAAVPPCVVVVVAKSYSPIHHQAILLVLCSVLYNNAL